MRKFIVLMLALAMVFSIAPATLAAGIEEPQVDTISVDWNDDKGNNMEGVGAAYAFNKGHGLMQLAEASPETVKELIELFFSAENGAGHTAVRTIIGDGGVRGIGTASRPGYNPVNGLRADAENPGFDVEGNPIPMSTRVYRNNTAARDDSGSATVPGTNTYLADPENHGFATNGTPLYGAYGYTVNDWGNRQYDGGSDTIWPNEGKYNAEGELVSGYGFVWDLEEWNKPVPGDTGGMTNNFVGLGEISVVERPRTMKELFDLDQVWIMRQALEYGVDTFYACAWTPPYWMKTSMSIFGNDPGNVYNSGGGAQDYLRAEVDENGNKIYYQAYADYLAAMVYGYWTEFGLPITHVGPFNESESSHGYSGFRTRSASDLALLVNDYILPTFERAFGEGGQYTGALNPDGEALNWVPELVVGDGTNLGASFGANYTGPYFRNSENYGKVTASTHLYGSVTLNNFGRLFGSGLGINPLVASASTTNSYPLDLNNYSIWQTEYMSGDGGSHSGAYALRGAYQTIDDAIRWSYLMSNAFNSSPGFNAYFYWWTIGNNGSSGSDLIRMQNTGSPQGNGSTISGTYTVFKRFYSFAHYSRFAKTGDIHIGSGTKLNAYLNSVAYRRPDGSDFSITLTNADYADKTVGVKLENFEGYTGELNSVTVFRTSDSENMKKLGTLPVTNGTITLELPAQSVVTLVPSDGEFAAYNGLDGERDLYTTLEATGNDAVIGEPAAAAGVDGYAALTMQNGDGLVYKNINFADGSINGGLVRKHLVYLMANVENTANGGILRAYVAEPGAEITDPVTQAVYVGEILIPAGTSSPRLAGITSSQLTGTRSTRIDTGNTGAYQNKDLYLVAFGEEGTDLFTISRFRFDADDNGTSSANNTPAAGTLNQNVRPAAVGVLVNGDFETTASAANIAGWNAGWATLAAVNEQAYSGLTSALNSTNAFSARLTDRTAGSFLRQDITGKVVEGEIYTFRGMFMPTANNATAKAELVYLREGVEIGRQTIAQRSGLDMLPVREGGAPFKLAGTSSGSFGDLTIPIAGIPMNTTSVNPVRVQVSTWHTLSGSFTYAPPENTDGVMLVLSDDQTATLYIDEVTLVSTPDRDALLAILAIEDEDIADLKDAARELYTAADATQAKILALLGQVPTVDKAALETLVGQVAEMDAAAYTTASWAGVAQALAAAEEVLANEGAKQAAVDDAYSALAAAVEALVEKKPVGSPDASLKEEEKYTRAVEGGYTMVSFKLYDEDKIVGYQLNDGAYNALTPNKYSDINYIKVGGSLKGAVLGLNTLKVFDALGNISYYEFVLVG